MTMAEPMPPAVNMAATILRRRIDDGESIDDLATTQRVVMLWAIGRLPAALGGADDG